MNYLTDTQIENIAIGKIQMSGTALVPDVLMVLERYKIKDILPRELQNYTSNIEKSDIYVQELEAYRLERIIEECFDTYFDKKRQNPYDLINDILRDDSI